MDKGHEPSDAFWNYCQKSITTAERKKWQGTYAHKKKSPRIMTISQNYSVKLSINELKHQNIASIPHYIHTNHIVLFAHLCWMLHAAHTTLSTCAKHSCELWKIFHSLFCVARTHDHIIENCGWKRKRQFISRCRYVKTYLWCLSDVRIFFILWKFKRIQENLRKKIR